MSMEQIRANTNLHAGLGMEWMWMLQSLAVVKSGTWAEKWTRQKMAPSACVSVSHP